MVDLIDHYYHTSYSFLRYSLTKNDWGVIYQPKSDEKFDPSVIHEYVLTVDHEDLGWAVVLEYATYYCDDNDHMPMYTIKKYLAMFSIKKTDRNKGLGRKLIERIREDHNKFVLDALHSSHLFFYICGASYLDEEIYEPRNKYMMFGSDKEVEETFNQFGASDSLVCCACGNQFGASDSLVCCACGNQYGASDSLVCCACGNQFGASDSLVCCACGNQFGASDSLVCCACGNQFTERCYEMTTLPDINVNGPHKVCEHRKCPIRKSWYPGLCFCVDEDPSEPPRTAETVEIATATTIATATPAEIAKLAEL